MIRELRSYDPKPGCQFSGASTEDVTPDVFVRKTRAGYAVELNQATLPRLLVNRRYYQELKSGPQDKAVARLAQRMPAKRELAGQGARPARADDRQGRVAKSSSGSRASSTAACRR